MSKFLQTDERAYRTCILYEVASETPIEEAFKRMKKVRPNVDYLDFEYWYFRFLKGNYDLDHDKNTDPKNRELSDMPIDVVERIVGNLDAVARLSLRKVSRTLRTIVDRNRFHCEYVRARVGCQASELSINGQLIKYKHAKKGITDLKFDRFSKKNVEGIHWMMVIEDLKSFITNPNWTFKTLKIENNYARSIISPSSSTNNLKIHVEHLDIVSHSLRAVTTILPYLDSNVLKTIRCWTDEIEMEFFKEIGGSDHWKKAEELHFKKIPNWFIIENLFHAKKFTVSDIDVSDDRLEIIRDVLLKCPNFESCSLRDTCGYKHIQQVRNDLNDVMSEHTAYNARNGVYSIEGSNDYFKITCRENEKDESLIDILRIHT